ncbi:mannosyl-oligosaccharide 1,2-alpha-mannosidase [Schizosaccharomyces japonicus yFS275]|uniref:alpha-1,2-Mannosidase n=1 Tax=Schizosaccharomyces japonicus (strain yFS275 / FY16936) TaxID=402676 RepID=B6K350_SCHJY|nr:mannosyl-oligosaccharide 1,2-alpha-mannosidase [Schizosaccharomyces japonicus yFS275]EEB07907.2 mannosyl-oligosaccharide 1,2-alpha-mannosidase [Schizosaccharomyces japonicus yFS275]
MMFAFSIRRLWRFFLPLFVLSTLCLAFFSLLKSGNYFSVPSWAREGTTTATAASSATSGQAYEHTYSPSIEERKRQVKQAFLDSWEDYEEHGWGWDEYHPVSKTGKFALPKGLGWIIIDSLDTMMIMGLDDKVQRARSWIQTNLTWDQGEQPVNVFEMTIRMLGGLLSAYTLSGNDPLYLEKATDLGDRLLAAYDTPYGLPLSQVNLKQRLGVKSFGDNGMISTAEAGTVQLEMRYLSHITRKPEYWRAAERAARALESDHRWNQVGLVPIYINPNTGSYSGKTIRLGSRGDSYYEYLLKQFLQTKRAENVYYNMYKKSMDAVLQRLVNKTVPGQLTYIGELPNGLDGAFSPKMDHLVCFMGGNLALGATFGVPYQTASKSWKWSKRRAEQFELAQELTRTCYEMYRQTKTGIAPEIVVFNRGDFSEDDMMMDFRIKPLDAHNLLRPETVESLFILWRLTKNHKYREWGWEIFKAFDKYSRTPDGRGFTSLESVKFTDPVQQRDNTESFWWAETLKYLYLLFEDDESVLPLTEYTFNTEAHPFPNFIKDSYLYPDWTL